MKILFFVYLLSIGLSPLCYGEGSRIPQFKKIPKDAIPHPGVEGNRDLQEQERIRATDGPTRLGFAIEFDDLRNYWSVMTAARLPRQIISIRIGDGPANGKYKITADDGTIEVVDERAWYWQAPREPGLYRIEIKEQITEEVMILNMAVLHRWDGAPVFNNYKIGQYQEEWYKDLSIYKKPVGFIEVTEENKDTWVSPHFRLKQFVCKQTDTYPRYILLEARLLLKLELLIENLENKGFRTDGFYLMSGYRTPAYNRAIGNSTTYSRHLYGDAADIYVDVNGDGRMDDLDLDGVSGDSDADILFEAVHEILTEPWHDQLIGGLGFYKNRSYRGPFIHIDTRGYDIEWGKPKPKQPETKAAEAGEAEE
ncbi:MAG: D-Ala-D-Ala carboxypeptidase family metallohydrolase [Verrucomicrobiales bacterium]|nr:D-Ala-D-Ala carboxypeptidase family metallohydrolase [Verrucomicrobiales bacterium]